MFISSFRSWESLFGDAAAFATKLGRDRLICISHSEDQNQGVVAVWYWDWDDEISSEEARWTGARQTDSGSVSPQGEGDNPAEAISERLLS